MSNPQKENGFTAIANEIMEALARIRISGEARQILDFILRKTYGFNKKEDAISLSQFVLGTGLTKPTISRAIKKLMSMKLIDKKDNDIAYRYKFNKDYSSWKPLTKKITLTIKSTTIDKKVNNSLTIKSTTKVDITKTTTTKEKDDIIYKDFCKLIGKYEEKLAFWDKYDHKEIDNAMDIALKQKSNIGEIEEDEYDKLFFNYVKSIFLNNYDK